MRKKKSYNQENVSINHIKYKCNSQAQLVSETLLSNMSLQQCFRRVGQPNHVLISKLF